MDRSHPFAGLSTDPAEFLQPLFQNINTALILLSKVVAYAAARHQLILSPVATMGWPTESILSLVEPLYWISPLPAGIRQFMLHVDYPPLADLSSAQDGQPADPDKILMDIIQTNDENIFRQWFHVKSVSILYDKAIPLPKDYEKTISDLGVALGNAGDDTIALLQQKGFCSTWEMGIANHPELLAVSLQHTDSGINLVDFLKTIRQI